MAEWKNTLEKWRARLAWASLPLCFVGLFLLDAALRYFYRFAGSTRFLDWRALVFTAAWSLFLTALAALLPVVARRVAFVAYGLFFGLLTIVHGVMFNIFGKFFTFSDTHFAGDGAQFFSWSYLRLRKAFVLCIVAAVLCLVLAAILAPKAKAGKRRWPWRVGAAAVMALSLTCVGLLHTALLPRANEMTWGTVFDANSEAQSYKEFTDSNRNLMITGLYQYTLRDFLVSYGLEENPVRLADLDNFYQERAQEVGGENEMTGRFAGKNLIMVMLESIDTWLLTPDYMPNLYALQQEGTNFVNHYTPLFLSAGTFCTEFISQTGLLPSLTGLSSDLYSTNAFPNSLGHLFGNAGYTTGSFHTANPGIYSRGTIHANLGMTYHSGYDMGMDDTMLDTQMIRGYDVMTAQEPFFTYIITYSGHGPYNEEMADISASHIQAAREAVANSGVEGSAANMEEYTQAVAHAMETDAFIGLLVSRLEEDGLLEDTVLLFYTDHYGKYMSDKEFLCQLKGVSAQSADLYRTPCFFYLKGEQPRTVDKYVSAVDIAPTVANLFGLPVQYQYFMGDDIFGSQGGVVMFPNGGWYDGVTYYTSGYQGEVTEEIRETSAQVKRREQASFDTLKSDYFAHREVG